MQQVYLAIFWTISSLLGLLITGHNTREAIVGYRKLRRFGCADKGMMILAKGCVRQQCIMIWMHLTFFIVGILASFPHIPDDTERTLDTVVIMTIPLFLIAISLFTALDRDRAARSYINASKPG